LLTVRTSHPTDAGIQYEDEREIVFIIGERLWGVWRRKARIRAAEIEGIPNIIAPFGKGNDVRDHMSLTHTLRDEKWACWSRDMVLKLRQYRMSLDVVASPLTSFSSSREFVGATADAIEGKTSFAGFSQIIEPLFMQLINIPTSTLMFSIVIRDISAGNILITYKGKSLLIDWDLCVKLIEPNNGNKFAPARRPDRTVSIYFFAAHFSDSFLRGHGSLCQPHSRTTRSVTNSRTTANDVFIS
jgi:hypothetical protein